VYKIMDINNIVTHPKTHNTIDMTYFKTKPYNHQYDCWDISKDKESFGLFIDMGGGKTKVLIDNVVYLYLHNKIDGVIVFAPKGCYRNWITEFELHSKIDYELTYWSAAANAKLKESYNKLFKKTGKLKVFLINTEAMSSSAIKPMVTKFVKEFSCLVCVDESTMIKALPAARTKAIIAIGKLAKYRRILTGLPITKNVLDLYSQCYFLDYRLLGFQSFYSFRNRYAIMQDVKFGPRSFSKIVGFHRTEELIEKLKGFSYRVAKKDCLDLPPQIFETRLIELTDEQKKLYNAMTRDYIIELDTHGMVTAQMIMTKYEKLHQIICGHLKTDTGHIVKLKNNRILELLQILEEIDGKVIIWATYQEDIRQIYTVISEAYGSEKVAHYYGETPADIREIVKKRFQDPADPLQYFISNPATGRFGSTLTQASTVIYYSNSYDYEYRKQSEDRTHRIGSEIHDKILYIDFICVGTVDEKIVKSLKDKKQLADNIMTHLGKKSWKELFPQV
jgi:hypothetical protein